MPKPSSQLPERVTRGYWVAVGKLLRSHYQLDQQASRQAVSTYRAMLAKLKIGDEVYHAPIEETAEGIVNGGYVSDGDQASTIPESTHQGNP